MTRIQISLTPAEWQAIKGLLPDPDVVGITGIDPEPYEACQKLIDKIHSKCTQRLTNPCPCVPGLH